MAAKNKILIVVVPLVAFFVFILGWQLISFWQHRGLDKVSVEVIPNDSKLTVDGQEVQPGVIYLKPGSHRLVASRQYFENDTKIIDTRDTKKNDVIYLLPRAVSDEAREWLAQRPDVQRAMEAAGGAEAERNRRILLGKYPFLDNLPYETARYKIDYSITDSTRIRLTVTLYGVINGPSDYPQYKQQLKQYREEALGYLRGEGIDPSKFPIEYIPDPEE